MFNSKQKDILDSPITTITRGEVVYYLVIIGSASFLSFVGVSLISALIYFICFLITDQHIYLAATIALFSLAIFPIVTLYCLFTKDMKAFADN